MASLPPEKKQQCKEVFDFYDKDRDGQLTKEDFTDAMKSLGIFIPKEEMAELLDKLPVRDYEHFEGIAATKLSQKVNKSLSELPCSSSQPSHIIVSAPRRVSFLPHHRQYV